MRHRFGVVREVQEPPFVAQFSKAFSLAQTTANVARARTSYKFFEDAPGIAAVFNSDWTIEVFGRVANYQEFFTALDRAKEHGCLLDNRYFLTEFHVLSELAPVVSTEWPSHRGPVFGPPHITCFPVLPDWVKLKFITTVTHNP